MDTTEHSHGPENCTNENCDVRKMVIAMYRENA